MKESNYVSQGETCGAVAEIVFLGWTGNQMEATENVNSTLHNVNRS